jgi:hypothetical protein
MFGVEVFKKDWTRMNHFIGTVQRFQRVHDSLPALQDFMVQQLSWASKVGPSDPLGT